MCVAQNSIAAVFGLLGNTGTKPRDTVPACNNQVGRKSVSCALCNVRKEKRFCPVVHGKICAQCCGEQREVTLDCPSECPYLQQAREHEKPSAADAVEREALFPQLEIAEQFLYDREDLIFGLSFALATSARANRDLRDRDLLAALTSLAKSYETLVNSNLIYEPHTANVAQQAIAAEIESLVKEYRATEQRHTGYTQLRDSDVLKALVFLLRLGYKHTSGRPKSRGYLDFLLAQFPERQSAIAAPQDSGNRIIVP